MKITREFSLFLLLALAVTALADDRIEKLPREHRKWIEEEVVYIITEQEKDVFLSLETMEERDRFIEAFWERRDPDRLTAVNEFKEEHYRRLEYANRIFSRDAPRPGWRTDRGRFYITLGKPREILRFDGLNDIVTCELWFYNGDTRYGLPPRFNLLFFKEGDVGDYELYHPLGDGPEALLRGGQGYFRTDQHKAVDVLEITSMDLARASLTVDLTEPVGDFLAGRNSRQPMTPWVRPPLNVENVIANIEEYPQRRFKSDYLNAYLRYKDQVSADYSFRFVPSRPFFTVLYGPDNVPFVHFSLELDAENFSLQANENGTRFYTTLDVTVEVRTEDGLLVAASENSPYLELTSSQMEAVAGLPVAYHDDFPLIPGDYQLSLIVKNRVTKQFTAAERDLRVDPVPEGSAVISVVLGHKTELTASNAHRVFQIGSEILYPAVDSALTPGERAYVLAQLANTSPEHRVKVSLQRADGNGEKVQDHDVSLLPDDTGSILSELSLVGLESGEYKVLVELLDPSSQVVSERSVDLHLSPRTSIPRAGFVFRHSFNAEVPGLLAMAVGQQYLALGLLAEAEKAFSVAVAAENPSLVMATWKLANVLLYSNQVDRVLELLLPLESSYGNEPDVVDGLGLAYYLKGDFAKAVRYLEHSLTLRPPPSQLLNALADAYQNVGQLEKAKQLFERSLSLNPQQEAVKERLALLGKTP